MHKVHIEPFGPRHDLIGLFGVQFIGYDGWEDWDGFKPTRLRERAEAFVADASPSFRVVYYTADTESVSEPVCRTCAALLVPAERVIESASQHWCTVCGLLTFFAAWPQVAPTRAGE